MVSKSEGWRQVNATVISWTLVVVGILLRNLVGLTSSPPGMYVDETSIAYNAWAIGQHGVDEHGVILPLYPAAFGEFKNPVYIYVLAALSRLVGMSVFVARFPAAVFGLLACLFVALAVRRFTRSDLAGWVTLLLAGLTPWLTQESRLAFEVISMVALLAGMIACLAEATASKDNARRWFVCFGIAAALSIFAYSTARLEVALFAVVFVLFFLRSHQRNTVMACIPILAGFVTLSLWMLAHPGALTARYEFISITRDHPAFSVAAGRFLRNFGSYFSADFLFFHGDPNPRHSTGWGGELLPITFPLAAAGLVWCLRSVRTRAEYGFLTCCLLLGPVAAALTDNGTPHSLRAASMLPFLLVLAGIGFHALCRLGARIEGFTTGTAAVVVTATLASGVPYLGYMYTAYAQRADVAAAFGTGEISAIVAAKELAGPHTVHLLNDQYLVQPYIKAAYAYRVQPPSRPIRNSVPRLLAPLRMIQHDHFPETSTLQAGDVVVVGRGNPAAPPGSVLKYQSQGTRVYVVQTSAGSRTLGPVSGW